MSIHFNKKRDKNTSSYGIFMSDFERTENSDHIHGVIGRALIIGTRFEGLCNSYARCFEYKSFLSMRSIMEDEAYFADYIKDINDRINKFQNLNSSINKIVKPDSDISNILHKARKARNTIAHSLTSSLDACADLRINNQAFIEDVTNLISDIADGDILISTLITLSNKDDLFPRHITDPSGYKDNIINWVTEERSYVKKLMRLSNLALPFLT